MKNLKCLFVGCVLLAAAQPASATVWFLQDDNSHISVSDDTIQSVFGWTVDGSFQGGGRIWYREGATGGESFLGTVAPVSASQSASNLLSVTYDLGNFTIQADYELQGKPLGEMEAQFFQTVIVSNSSIAAIDLQLFKEWEFQLGNSGADDSLFISGGNLATQQDAGWIGESRYSSVADHYLATTNNLIFELGDSNPTTFPDTSGPVGPGNLSSGFQWDITLGVGETQTFTVEHHVFVVPEPSTMILMMIAGVGCWGSRKRRSLVLTSK